MLYQLSYTRVRMILPPVSTRQEALEPVSELQPESLRQSPRRVLACRADEGAPCLRDLEGRPGVGGRVGFADELLERTAHGPAVELDPVAELDEAHLRRSNRGLVRRRELRVERRQRVRVPLT